MPPSKRARPAPGGPADSAVATFLAGLDHPLKPEIEAVRAIILGVDPSITEAIKWNAPSFRTTEFFATTHLRSTDGVQLVFHTGAKKKAEQTPMNVPDPAGLLKWLAPDRCLVSLGKGPDIEARRPALEAIVRAWIAGM